MKNYRLGIDIGGTFTDLVLLDEATGESRLVKMSSTPQDPSQAFMNVVRRIVSETGIDPEAAGCLIHGTTVATNTIIEGKGAKAAFITTEGFRDMLEIARQIRPRLYDLNCEKPPPLIPRRLCFEVPERLDAAGQIVRALDEAAVESIAEKLRQAQVESVVICLLHSYINADHERRVADILAGALPDVSLSCSSDVCPEIREYYRASTTAINAVLVPVVGRYIQRLKTGVSKEGFTADIRLMTSSGGVISSKVAEAQPVHLIESGPAAGVTAAAFFGELAGTGNVISFDMGGTTAKLGLIEGGAPRRAPHFEVGAEASVAGRAAGYPVRTPVVDLVEIGAGGGSIARIDAGGALRVGPQSGGADPGPACYDNGQTEPCITDANVVLGRINPNYFIGGERVLRRDLAEQAAQRLADRLGLDLLAAACGIIEIANANMIAAARTVSVQRGFDPRDFTLVAFGGAGPLHANAMAKSLSIPRLLIPKSPGVTSALGLLVGDIRHEYSATCLMPTTALDRQRLEALLAGFEAEGRATLVSENVAAASMQFRRQADMRYQGQSHELTIDLPDAEEGTAEEFAAKLDRLFFKEHERVYGFCDPDEPTEVVSARLSAIGIIRRPTFELSAKSDASPDDAVKETRPVYFEEIGGLTPCRVYDRNALSADQQITGPAIVEEYDSTTLIHPGYAAKVDRAANLIITEDS